MLIFDLWMSFYHSLQSSLPIYLLMGAATVCGIFLWVQLFRVGRSLKRATETLEKELVRNQLTEWFSDKDKPKVQLFSVLALQKRLQEYADEYSRRVIAPGVAPFLDINKYFNPAFLDEISHDGLCDLIPSVMTGLGILGTFLGLTQGISGFDTSSTEMLMSGITQLLGGMGTAFWTSIVGVFLQLLLSFTHKWLYSRASQELEGFVTSFHAEKLDGGIENTSQNLLLNYQRQQTDQMTRLSKEVSEAICGTLTSTLKSEMIPIVDKMSNTVSKFCEFATKQQLEGLDRIVQAFLDRMDQSLNGQFERLGNTIQTICQQQEENEKRLKAVVDEICQSSDEIERINHLSQTTVKKLSEYVVLLEEYQEKLSSEARLVQERLNQSEEINNRQAEYLNQLVECEGRIADLADHVKQEADAAQRSVELMSNACVNLMNETASATKKSVEEMASSTLTQLETRQRQMGEMVRLAADSCNELVTKGTGTQQKVQSLTDSFSSLIEEYQQQMKNVAKDIADATQTASQTKQAIELLTGSSKTGRRRKSQNQKKLQRKRPRHNRLH